jgi:hypothetical protein
MPRTMPTSFQETCLQAHSAENAVDSTLLASTRCTYLAALAVWTIAAVAEQLRHVGCNASAAGVGFGRRSGCSLETYLRSVIDRSVT